jgi:hypothetical protein
MSFRPRIVVASPHVAECNFVSDWLTTEGFEPVRVSNLSRAAEELKERSFDLLVVDAGFAFRHDVQAVNVVRARNPQTPIVVIGDPDAASESQAAARGAMFLARPVDRALLVCTVSMAVMESRPVRRSERKRVWLDAVVEGVPSHIIDVSKEGLRLEIPRIKNAPPPPVFNVGVPMLGVALTVRRLWTCTPPRSLGVAAWYGGELSTNSRKVEMAWLTLVDAMPRSNAAVELH